VCDDKWPGFVPLVSVIGMMAAQVVLVKDEVTAEVVDVPSLPYLLNETAGVFRIVDVR
jgi:hypothetical protein